MVKKYIPIPPWTRRAYVLPDDDEIKESSDPKKSTIKLKPSEILKIYAESLYGIPIEEYERVKLIRAVRIDLGIYDKSKLIPKDERLKNFELFEKIRFNNDDPWGVQLDGVFKKGTSAYNYLKLYSQTNFGSTMIDRINRYDGKFTVYAITRGDKKFQAMGATDHIRLPVDFPLLEKYPFTDQLIDPLAVIHHEFEHTRFGLWKYDVGSLREEVAAVVHSENTVRILRDFEPRYVYYQRITDTTVSIFDYTNTMSGGRTYDPLDPRKLK